LTRRRTNSRRSSRTNSRGCWAAEAATGPSTLASTSSVTKQAGRSTILAEPGHGSLSSVPSSAQSRDRPHANSRDALSHTIPAMRGRCTCCLRARCHRTVTASCGAQSAVNACNERPGSIRAHSCCASSTSVARIRSDALSVNQSLEARTRAVRAFARVMQAGIHFAFIRLHYEFEHSFVVTVITVRIAST